MGKHKDAIVIETALISRLIRLNWILSSNAWNSRHFMKQIKLNLPCHHPSRTSRRPLEGDSRSPSWTTRWLGFGLRRGPTGKRWSLSRFLETSRLFCCSQGRWGWRSRRPFYCARQQCVARCVRISVPANTHKLTLKNGAPCWFSLKFINKSGSGYFFRSFPSGHFMLVLVN